MVFAIGGIAFMLSLGCTALIRRYTLAHSILDTPNERSSHTQPTPRGGGLAIVGITLVGLAVLGWLLPTGGWSALGVYSAGAAVIALVSWLDDLYGLSNRLRLVTHAGCAVIVILGFGFWQSVTLPMVGLLQLGLLGVPLTFFWIVGLTNAYNFMDGIDGLAAGQAVIAGVSWSLLGWLAGLPVVTALGWMVATSAGGFLWYNWSPARIFMGDVGSAFLGYTFAVLPLIAAPHDPRFVLTGLLILWPFLFDTIFTFLRRLRAGENVFAAHRSHVYQRLVIAGWSHRAVTLLYLALALAGVLSAALLLWGAAALGVAALFGLALMAAWLVWLVRRYEGSRTRIRPNGRSSLPPT